MKKKNETVKLIAVALVTGFISALSIYLILPSSTITEREVIIERSNETPVMGAAYMYNEDGEPVPLDFTVAAEKTMNAVVHIKSKRLVPDRNFRSRPHPFRDFFGDEFFDNFFGPGQRQQAPNQPNEPRYQMGSGSGVIMTEGGYIITNNHVIDGADEIEVTLYDNRSFPAALVGTDPNTDLAVLKIETDGLNYLKFHDSDATKVGEWVLAVGNPFNLNSTVTAGIISAKARNINILREQYAIESFIQTDAAINPGNSGGALVDLQGGLIGINTAIASPTGSYSGYGFAVPSNIVSKVLEDIIEYGTVQRGFLGVMIREVNSALAEEKNLKVGRGVYVDSVTVDGAAEKAGILSGDVITSIDGKVVTTTPQLMAEVAKKRPGDELSVNVDRKGKSKEIKVVLKNQQGTFDVITKEVAKRVDQLGATFTELSKEDLKKENLKNGVQVTRLAGSLLQQRTSMKDSFIITKVDGQPVNKPEDIEKILKDKTGGVLIEGKYPGQNSMQYYALGLDS
ncbi:MAG: Do family serine endopeptidase [Cyclobacteriaceae bacterium]|nr:Do family serine endopeptidase [Cyclobacteriaceae bacterium]MCH8515706.1 Do family serine endopeptidase [Cyclobacteriaceae bacterium]